MKSALCAFDVFLGNPAVKRQLVPMIDRGQLPHALLIEGAGGLGKRTLARLTAKAVLCKSGGGRSCGICESCKKADKKVHPDIITVESTGGARSFHVDEIRKLKSQAYVLPNESEHKIFLLFNAHDMSVQAQNALLKLLEEPPGYGLFILTCESSGQMLETVRSRCMTLTLTEVSREETLRGAKQAGTKALEDEIDFAYGLLGGNIGRVIELLGDKEFAKAAKIAENIALSLAGDSEYELLKALGLLEKDKSKQQTVLNLLLRIIKNAVTAGASDKGQSGAAVKLAENRTVAELAALYTTAADYLPLYDYNPNNTLLLTALCSSLYQKI